MQVQYESSMKRVGSLFCCPPVTAGKGLGALLVQQAVITTQPHLSVPLFHGEVNEGGDNKGFPGHFLLRADKKRQND